MSGGKGSGLGLHVLSSGSASEQMLQGEKGTDAAVERSQPLLWDTIPRSRG